MRAREVGAPKGHIPHRVRVFSPISGGAVSPGGVDSCSFKPLPPGIVLAAGDVGQKTQVSARRGSSQGKRRPSLGKKILLVDDDRLILYSVSGALEARGHQVWATDSAEQALTLAREIQPDVVVTDYRMPQMDGISLLKRLKGLALAPRMVVYTGEELPTGPEVHMARELTWVVKVAGHGTLLETLERLLEE